MPNWCRNRVDFYSENKEDLKKVLDIFSNKESVFGQIIPEPDWKTTPNKDGELPVDREYLLTNRLNNETKKHALIIGIIRRVYVYPTVTEQHGGYT